MTDQTTQKRSLDDLYADKQEPAGSAAASDAPPAEATGDKQPSPTEARTDAPPTGDAKAEAEKGKDGAPPAPDEEADDRTVPFKALKDERRKRQELEKKFQDLERKVSQPAAREPDEAPDPLVEPDRFRQHMDNQRFTERVELTRELMIDKVGEEDFKAAEAAFIDAAQADPKLAVALRSSANPARFAYSEGKKRLETAKDPSEELFASFKSRLEQDYDLVPKQKPAGDGAQKPTGQAASHATSSQPKTQPRLPTSLAGVQSAGPRNAGARSIQRRSLEELYDN